jgi:hypothetical protein
LALGQVRSVLATRAIFILEYANKHNLKAILRYLVRKQDWSPFTQEAIEFARLNFDFHPKAIKRWLGKNNFFIERQLTVSHFRAGFLKKLLPVKFLATLDGLFQPAGAWFQLTPSVFLRARATGDVPQIARDLFFKCLDCGTGLTEFTGTLHCPGCGHVWQQKKGIYDFRLDK